MSAPTPACRSCGGEGLVEVLSLGEMPLANALLKPQDLEAPEPRYPLDLAVCPHCSLAQITFTVPPQLLFSQYLYFSSFSDTMLAHARELAGRLIRERKLGPTSLVVEAASNDGYLLQYYHDAGVPVLGIEPAANVARVATQERRIPTLCEFFSLSLARRLKSEGQAADIIHAHNVLAHVSDLNGFVAGMAHLLKDEGLVVIEVPNVREMLRRCEFDTIYHEHLCYFSLPALAGLLRRQGLEITAAEPISLHGGSIRVFAAKSGGSALPDTSWAQADLEAYRDFAGRVEALKSSLRTLVGNLKADGARLAAYGAAAKGCMLLNYTGIGAESLDYVVDRSPYKQGLYLPGVHLPIYPPGKLEEDLPDYCLLLAWNFAPEILAQQAGYRRRGGRFIQPIPQPEVI